MAEDEVQGLQNLIRRIHQLKSDMRNTERALAAAGAYMLGSIEKNFREQGRPIKWQGLAASTLAARAKRGSRRRKANRPTGSPQILIDTARLKNSIAFKVVGGGVGVEIGTNVKYAKRQQFGYPKGEGRGHSATPARAFLLVQPEDVDVIGSFFKRHIARER
jgi:phage gpG-like protein